MEKIFKNTKYSKIKKKRGGENDPFQNKIDEKILDLLNNIKNELIDLNGYYYKNIEGENIIKQKSDDDPDMKSIMGKGKLFKLLESNNNVSFYVTKISIDIDKYIKLIKQYKSKTNDKFVIITNNMSTYKDIAELDNVIFLDLSNPTSTISAYNKVQVFPDPFDDTLSYIFLYGGFDNIDSYKNDIGNSGLIVSKLVSVILKGQTRDGGSTGLKISEIAYMWELLGLSKIITNESPELFYFRKKGNSTYRAFTDSAYKQVKVSTNRKTDEILKEIQKNALIEDEKEAEEAKKKKKGNSGDGKKLSTEEIARINNLFNELRKAKNIEEYVNALTKNFVAFTEDKLKAIQEESQVNKDDIKFSNETKKGTNEGRKELIIKYKSPGPDRQNNTVKVNNADDQISKAIKDYIVKIKNDDELKDKKYRIPYSTKNYNPEIALQ